MASGALAMSGARANGVSSQPSAEEEELYAQLLRLRDAVVAGKHHSLKLPPAAIQRLRASLLESDVQPYPGTDVTHNRAVNNSAFSTNHEQFQQSHHSRQDGYLPGLQSVQAVNTGTTDHRSAFQASTSTALHPIFLEKSGVVVKAEVQLKRRRLDRELQTQVDQRKNSSREKEPGSEGASAIDVVAVLASALERVQPISGLKRAEEAGDSSSFDENDYYSSQVQSDWSSEASADKASDTAAGAFTADFERLDGSIIPNAESASRRAADRRPDAVSRRSRDNLHSHFNGLEESYATGDEDDDYTPPDAAAFDSFRDDDASVDMGQVTPPDDDDNSDYEPGEITDSNTFTPRNQAQHHSPHVPVIRNHLTHIVAPQPSRVSPLATAKGASYELELVNGRPEMVPKPQPQQQKNMHSRLSSASPPNNNMAALGVRKQRQKKRKRAVEPAGGKKRRKDKQTVSSHDDPHVKHEPVSPPPYASLQNVTPYNAERIQARPVSIDLTSPRYAPGPSYPQQPSGANLRYERTMPTSPAFVQVAHSPAQRPLQRDTQDLRRVASLQYAQRAPSPPRDMYSPVAPYAAVPTTYSGRHASSASVHLEPGYDAIRVQSRNAAREYGPSQVEMPPPAAPARKIIVDQHGNRYYEATPAPSSRASVMPPQSMPPPASLHERRITYPSMPYGSDPSTPIRYEAFDSHAAPSPSHSGKPALLEPYTERNGRSVYEFQDPNSSSDEPRYPQAIGHAEAPKVPSHMATRGYEQVPVASRQHTVSDAAPTFQPQNGYHATSRSYSVRPDDPHQLHQGGTNYLRHASVAPVQYALPDASQPPMRAVSVMPSSEYGMGNLAQQLPHQQLQPQRAYSQIPTGVRYVDQYGNEVFPHEVREVRYG